MRRGCLLHLTLLLAFLLAVSLPFLAQTGSNETLSNADIVKMVKAGLPESVIVRKIQMSQSVLGASAAALIDLKNHGASESILNAVLDSQAGPREFAPGFPQAPQIAVPSAHGPYRLPNLEADMRFNAKTTGKLKMSKNQIKVERAGVPLFSVKWKENPPSK